MIDLYQDTQFFIKDFPLTLPLVDLAQPFRSLAHNGEINTLKGNINWMKVHEQEMQLHSLKISRT